MLPVDRRVFPILLVACLVLACGGSDRTAGEGEGGLVSGFEVAGSGRWVDPMGWREYADFLWLLDALAETPLFLDQPRS